MTKYLKLMTYAAVAVALASPAYADVVNLYEMNNMEFFGSDGFGKGSGDFKYKCDPEKYEYENTPSGMTCGDRTYPGGVTCYINCRCTDDYKYSEDNCNNGLAPEGASCTTPGTTKALYTACGCGPDNITENDYSYLSQYFTEGSFKTETVDDKTCMFISNPSCKQGYDKLSYNPPLKSTWSYGRYTATMTNRADPLKYSFAASSSDPTTPGTVFCLINIDILDNFRSAVSFYEDDLNATCATTAKATSLIGNKEYFYYTDVCQTGNHSDISCDVSGVPTAQQSSFSYYDNVTNSVKSITCSYVSTSNYCTTNGYKKSCDTDEMEDGAPCEYDTTYKKCIKKEDWCKNNGYNVTESSCRILQGFTPTSKCPNHSSYYRTCRDNDDICSENYRDCKQTTHVGEGATCQGRTKTYYERCTLIADWCKKNGFKNPCPSGQVATDESCQYDATYKKCISYADWCKNNNYKNSCQTGYELSGEACPYDLSYKKDCTKKQSETDKCKAQGYTIQCQSGYFNNGESCTGDNNTKWYKTNCTKITCNCSPQTCWLSNDPTRECGSKGGCKGVHTHFEYTIANDGKTKCYYPCNSRGFGTRCDFLAVDTDDVDNSGSNFGSSANL